MKKILSILLSITFLISCDTDNSDGLGAPSSLGLEQGKQELEDNMISALNEINIFRNDAALSEIEEFAKFMLDNEPEPKSGKKFVAKSFRNVLNYKNVDLQTFSKSQIAAVNEPAEDLQADYNEQVGIWIWNSTSEEFEQTTTTGDKIIFKVTQNNKNAVLTISNFSVLNHPSGEEIPTSVLTELVVDDSTIFSQSYSASFLIDKYIPQTVNNTITLGTMSFTTSASNNVSNTETNMSFAVLLNGKTLLGASVRATGNYTDIDNTGTSDNEINILANTLSASYTMLDATISIEATSPETIGDELTIDDELTLVNDNLKVSLSVNNKKIADGEFYKETQLEDVYEYHDDAKYVVQDGRPGSFGLQDGLPAGGQIGLFDTFTELESSIYYNNFHVYYHPRVILEEDLVTNDPWSYIYNKYTDGMYNGYYVSIEEKSSEIIDNNYLYTWVIYYNEPNVTLEESVINSDIWNYINNKYTDGKYNGSYVFSDNNYYYNEWDTNWYSTEKLVDSPNLKFIFEDGSKSTIEAYFDAGFNQLQTKADDVLINFEDLIED
jgi:hypothetical protein